MGNEYKQHLRSLAECVRKPEWRPRGKVEIEFLKDKLWPIFKSLPPEVQEWEAEIRFAIDQLAKFFDGGSVDATATSIFAWFIQSTVGRESAGMSA